MSEENKFDKYKEVVKGQTHIILENEGDDVPDEEFDLIVKNSEKMMIMNYFSVQDQAKKNYDMVPPTLTDKLETLFFTLFRRAYPKDNADQIIGLVDDRFLDLITAFMIGFKWVTKEQLEKIKEDMKREAEGVKKKDNTPQTNSE